ncbi:MAG: cyclase family protein [Eubacteriales bacterium]|nr:cyclase family protein [Eubacteriales bacterium]
MRLHDISKELFSSPVYPGDPVPEKAPFLSIEKGDVCNLTMLSMGSHNGTHLDAPRHFIADGRDVSDILLEKTIGLCKVVEAHGRLTSGQIEEWMSGRTKKLLIKGQIIVTPQAAKTMVQWGLELLGVEGQTVGEEGTQETVHRILLGAEVVILEGLVLEEPEPGSYFLAAQPLKMAGLDGSPIRPVLISTGEAMGKMHNV